MAKDMIFVGDPQSKMSCFIQKTKTRSIHTDYMELFHFFLENLFFNIIQYSHMKIFHMISHTSNYHNVIQVMFSF